MESEAIYEQALVGYEMALGPEYTSTLIIINNLGNLYKSQGKLLKAETMCKRAMAGYKKALGPEHTSTLTTINNLGNLYPISMQVKQRRRQCMSELWQGMRRH